MKVVAIFGEPGSGKSTLMRRVLCELGFAKDTLKEDFKLVPYHKHENKYVLGKYEEGEVFAGTDRMSMAVQPEAIKFLDTLPNDSVVFFEGDRLCTASFLEHCNNKFDLKMVYQQAKSHFGLTHAQHNEPCEYQTWFVGKAS